MTTVKKPQPMAKATRAHRYRGLVVVVGGHEDGPQQQAPGEQVEQGVPAEEEGQHRHGAQVGQGDHRGDDPPGHQVDAPQQQSQGAGLPQAAAPFPKNRSR